MNRKDLSREINQLHARICSAISDPHRILLLYAIAEEKCNVNGLAERVGISQSAASRHLKVLKERGLVNSQRDGSQVIYSLTDDRYLQALDLLREVMLDQMAEQVNFIHNTQSMEQDGL